MQADIGGAPLVIARLPKRRARAHLFTASGRGLVVAGIAAVALIMGLGAATDFAHSAPESQATPLSYIGG